MYGLWAVAFGQSVSDFWLATPEQFYAIYDTYLEEASRDYLTSGTIVATLLNVNRSKKGGQAYTAEKIFPHLRGLERTPSLEQLKRRAIIAFGAKRKP